MGQCPCGSGLGLSECCGQYMQGSTHAPGAEKLMRSRFSAYALQNNAYLLQTWHHTTRPETISKNMDDSVQWTRLRIIAATDNTVEFIATYKINGKAHQLHEQSHFVKENGQWFYIDGEQYDKLLPSR
ncbi:MAG TPA: hypothetical protein ENI65_09485 [Gammaproteobacteria bacterium]|nr:hypothetical protein [Gammaproteobacteria bacterium]